MRVIPYSGVTYSEMPMLAKSLLIGSFLALLTVGVVYFGIGDTAVLDNKARASVTTSVQNTPKHTPNPMTEGLSDRAIIALIQTQLETGDVEGATGLIQDIKVANMRDTARSNIAIALAHMGRKSKAMALANDAESEAFAAIIRMQVEQSLPQPE